MVPIQFGYQSDLFVQFSLDLPIGVAFLVHTKPYSFRLKVGSPLSITSAGVVGVSGLPWSSSWQTCQLVFSETRDPAGPSTFLHHSMHDAASSSWV